MKIKLTKSNIDKIPFSDKQVVVWDSDLPGFGLRVGSKSKTFFVQTDIKDESKPKGWRVYPAKE